MKRRPRILAVDDEQPILNLLTRILEQAGYDVTAASNGKSALSIMEKDLPDLVILDVKMPEMNGFQVLESIRQRSDIPVIMLTGGRETNAVSHALNLGADDYMRKPFSSAELIARIRIKLKRAGL